MKSVLTLLTIALLSIGPSRAGTWKAGSASIAITPEESLWMAGYGSRSKPSEGKETELHAKVLVLEDAAGNRGLILTLDLVGIDRAFSQKITASIAKDHGIPREAVAICCSHTHSGPVLGRNLAALHYELLGPEEQAAVDRYAESFFSKISEVTATAIGRLAPARLQWGSGKCTFAVNRRENKEPEVPASRETGTLNGPVDHDVPVLSVRDEAGRLTAILFGYACHSTVLSGQTWNADYPGYAQTALEENFPGAVALFWAGCGGDQNPIPRRELPLAQAYGSDLADRVADVLRAPMNELSPVLHCAYEEVAIPLASLPGKSDLEAATTSTNRFEQARARYLLRKLEQQGQVDRDYPYPVSLWSLGTEIDFVFLGGEVVVDYALRLKRERRGLKTWVAGYSNDVMAYIPSLRVLREGGYEGGGSNVYYNLPGLWDESIEERIVAAVHKIGRVRGYPPEVREIRYPVPDDGSKQPALFWAPRLAPGEKAPLLVACHTWSGDYRQAGGEALYARWCLEQGWIFLHPDFRGPNRRPEALASDLAIADIRAAIEWARANASVDETRIYAVGASGGGHFTQVLAGRMPEVWAGISSWCGIADIAAWHAETTGAGRNNYAADIEGALGGAPDASDTTMAEASHRSPLTWLENAAGVPLDLNHGIDDGRAGSVPFTHSLRAYNAVVPEAERIAESDIAAWYADPASLPRDPDQVDALYGANPPIYRKVHGNTRVTIFQGGHEILHEAALNWLAAQRKDQPANWNPPKTGSLQATAKEQESGK